MSKKLTPPVALLFWSLTVGCSSHPHALGDHRVPLPVGVRCDHCDRLSSFDRVERFRAEQDRKDLRKFRDELILRHRRNCP